MSGFDEDLVERHRSFRHVVDGREVEESFLQPLFLGTAVVAVLYRPVADPLGVAWVICHSFGVEQMLLMEHEVPAARALAARGWPVLRYHGRGYGESLGGREAIGLGSHLEDAREALALCRAQTGATRVGLLGARFGCLFAALTADREGMDLLALWEPAVKGSAFARELLRSRDLRGVLRRAPDDTVPGEADPMEELQTQGWTDVRGMYVSKGAFEEISAVDLTRDVERFAGDALIVGVTRAARPSTPAAKLAEHLRSLGASVEEALVVDPEAGTFGQYHYDNEDDPNAKTDLQAGLERALAATTLDWADRRVGNRVAGGAPPGKDREGARP